MLQGYYSLIQYCPDWKRLEVCNIGVMLFCPQAEFLDAVMTHDNKRVRHVFGSQLRLDYLQTFKESFAERIRAEKTNLYGLDDLKDFIARRANSFLITEPRSIAVDDPQQTLAGLFTELFDEVAKTHVEKRESAKDQLYQALKKKFGVKLDSRVARGFPRIVVPIPNFHKTIQPCVGFQNGTFNLVVERKLTPDNSFRTMSSDMMIGRFLHETPDRRWGQQRLIILADTDDNAEVDSQIETFDPMMKENFTDIFRGSQKLATTIKKDAKPVPEKVREFLNREKSPV